MFTIKFIARPTREKLAYSQKDVNTYEVRYSPPRNGVRGTGSSDFSSLLLEAVCGLPKHNTDKRAVRVEVEGDFPSKYIDQMDELFYLYSKAESVDVGLYREGSCFGRHAYQLRVGV